MKKAFTKTALRGVLVLLLLGAALWFGLPSGSRFAAAGMIALIVPLVLIYYKFSSGYLIDAGLVAVGEIIACGVLGTVLVWYLLKHPKTAAALGGAAKSGEQGNPE